MNSSMKLEHIDQIFQSTMSSTELYQSNTNMSDLSPITEPNTQENESYEEGSSELVIDETINTNQADYNYTHQSVAPYHQPVVQPVAQRLVEPQPPQMFYSVMPPLDLSPPSLKLHEE